MIDPDTLFKLNCRLAALEAAMAKPEPKALTMSEACEALRVSEPTVRSWLTAGRLASIRTGPDGKSGSHLFPIEEIERFLNVRPNQQAAETPPAAPGTDGSPA